MSLSDADKTITTEDFDKLNEIIKYLRSIDIERNFHNSVDWKAFGLLDYPTIIRHPMDLSTLQKNLQERKYQLNSEVLDHIQLIWDNCKTYNIEGSVINLIRNLISLISRSINKQMKWKKQPKNT